MNNKLRVIVSSSLAVGLLAFTAISAFTLGAAAPATLLGFGFLAAYGVLEIAVASYEEPHRVFVQRRAPEAEIIPYPQKRHNEVARAA